MNQVIKSDWIEVFLNDLKSCNSVSIISPFIGAHMVNKLIANQGSKQVRIITRFNLNDFRSGVSSLKALEKLIDANIEVRGIKGLHTKSYIFDHSSVIIASANFTSGGFFKNKELGIRAVEKKLIQEVNDYFDELWGLNGPVLNNNMIQDWKKEIKKSEKVITATDLPDHGADPNEKIVSKRYFIKFFGKSDNRVDLNFPARDEVDRAHCHYAVCFPNGKGRPRRYKTGDIVYMARMLYGSDMAIFGKGEALEHVDSRDMASKHEINLRNWKNHWGTYIRVKNTEFIDGIMGDCPLVSQLINDLGFESYQSTSENYELGNGKNIEPWMAVRQQADVQLSVYGAKWMEDKFQQAINASGRIPDSFIKNLDQGSLDPNSL